MFYAISGINGDYEAYKRALKKLKFQNLDDIKEEDIMNEEAVISTLEGEDVLYVLGNIIGAGGGSMKILQDMMSRDNVIAVVGENEYKITQALKALNDHIQSTGEVPPQMLVDKITSMLGEELSGAVEEFLQLDDEEREDVIEYIDEISEEAFLEVMMARKKFVLVHAGIRNFDPKKELDEYDTEDFITEHSSLDMCQPQRSAVRARSLRRTTTLPSTAGAARADSLEYTAWATARRCMYNRIKKRLTRRDMKYHIPLFYD